MDLDLQTLMRLAIALLLSGVLGWERESAGKPAGLRTHILVGAGAALFVALGEMLVLEFDHFGELQRFDPTRIIEAVVAGVSFLGAGTIFFNRRQRDVHGLTTAASLWTTAGVGLAVGMGRYLVAAGATVMLFAVLRGVAWLEEKSAASPKHDEALRH